MFEPDRLRSSIVFLKIFQANQFVQKRISAKEFNAMHCKFSNLAQSIYLDIILCWECMHSWYNLIMNSFFVRIICSFLLLFSVQNWMNGTVLYYKCISILECISSICKAFILLEFYLMHRWTFFYSSTFSFAISSTWYGSYYMHVDVWIFS